MWNKSKATKQDDYVKLSSQERLSIIEKACQQVSRGVFYSTIIIITSFLPVFFLLPIFLPFLSLFFFLSLALSFYILL